jgi:hypothetical protein
MAEKHGIFPRKQSVWSAPVKGKSSKIYSFLYRAKRFGESYTGQRGLENPIPGKEVWRILYRAKRFGEYYTGQRGLENPIPGKEVWRILYRAKRFGES